MIFKKKESKIALKTFFLIANLMIAIVAFSYLIRSVDAQCGPNGCATGAGGTGTTPASVYPGAGNTPGGYVPTGGTPPSSAPLGSEGSAGTNSKGVLDGIGKSFKDFWAVGGNSGGTVSPEQYAQGGKTPGGSINAGGDAGNTIGNTGNPANPGQTYEEQIGGGGQNPFGSVTGPGSDGGRVGPGTGTGPNIGGTGPGTGNGVPNYPPGGGPPNAGGTGGFGNGQGPGVGGGLTDYFTNFFEKYIWQLGAGAGIGALIGSLAGGKNGGLYGTIAGVSGVFAYQMAREFGLEPLQASLIGIGVFLLIFLLTYKKEHTEVVEFNCLPWQAPVGGGDCEKCNDYPACSEYSCKSLGQACDLVNAGTKEQKCIWKNPYDTNSPIIEMKNVSSGLKFFPDATIRPPATGVKIVYPSGKGQCIKAFTPLEFTFITNEPAQCKIDYNLTTDSKLAFEQMGFYVGGVPTFLYNHTEKLALPGPDAINKVDPSIQNDGTYTLYIRCSDANGNFNVNPFAVRFCVEKGPDTTPPMIVNVSIPSRSPIQFNISNLDLEVYVNEPADCKWSREDRDYDLMEGNMSCDNSLWEMNNEETYTCRTTLTGIESRKENLYFFRCKDKPDYDESERNVNKKSYSYIVIGTQPLNILDFGPNETIFGATDTIPVYLFIKTDNGYSNGEARCYYSTTGNEADYIEFSNTSTVESFLNYHTQRQDLITGDYIYYYKCVDLGGNAVYNVTRFRVETDELPPFIIRTYKESGELKITTQENAECSYSNTDCNFEIDSGIKMTSLDYLNHNTEWKSNKYYYIRCKDKYNNQPNPNICSLIIKPFEYSTMTTAEGTIEL